MTIFTDDTQTGSPQRSSQVSTSPDPLLPPTASSRD